MWLIWQNLLSSTYTTLQAEPSVLTCPPSLVYFSVSRFAKNFQHRSFSRTNRKRKYKFNVEEGRVSGKLDLLTGYTLNNTKKEKIVGAVSLLAP